MKIVNLSRRRVVRELSAGMALGLGALGMVPLMKKSTPANLVAAEAQPVAGKRIHHSVCRGTYNDIPLDVFCEACKKIGMEAIDLLGPKDFDAVKKYGLTVGMVYDQPEGYGLPRGFNHLEHHDALVAHYEKAIPVAAAAGMKNLICFSGNRAGLSDEAGMKNCAAGIKKLAPLAEKYNVTLAMELLNSKIDHKDYQCDHTNWGVALCKMVGSDRFKLLYDIYHMQIQEGDVIRTIRENAAYICHFHTGGVPGRHEIDDTQELYYPAVMRAIADTGFQGFVAQEFSPVNKDKLFSLRQAIRICDV